MNTKVLGSLDVITPAFTPSVWKETALLGKRSRGQTDDDTNMNDSAGKAGGSRCLRRGPKELAEPLPEGTWPRLR